MFFLGKRGNLTQPIQMQVPKKVNVFSQLFIAFLKFLFNFEHFQKKDEPHSLCISEIIDGQRRA